MPSSAAASTTSADAPRVQQRGGSLTAGRHPAAHSTIDMSLLGCKGRSDQTRGRAYADTSVDATDEIRVATRRGGGDGLSLPVGPMARCHPVPVGGLADSSADAQVAGSCRRFVDRQAIRQDLLHSLGVERPRRARLSCGAAASPGRHDALPHADQGICIRLLATRRNAPPTPLGRRAQPARRGSAKSNPTVTVEVTEPRGDGRSESWPLWPEQPASPSGRPSARVRTAGAQRVRPASAGSTVGATPVARRSPSHWSVPACPRRSAGTAAAPRRGPV